MKCLLVLVVAAACGGYPRSGAPAYAAPVLLYAWSSMPYEFRTPVEADAYRTSGTYKKTALAGVHVDRQGNVYVSTPRWLDARVPATLSRIVSVGGKPVLRPFPSWDANRVGAPGALQNVLGFAIDHQDRMWILDMGWVAGVDPTPDGAQKLVVIDLATGKELRHFTFPDTVADRRFSFLNDLAIDEQRGLAYISDSGNRAGSPTASGIVIYDLATDTARRVLDRDPRVGDDPARTLTVAGERVLPDGRLAIGINGISLADDGATLYWSITTGDAIYHAPTAVLRDPAAAPARVAEAVAGPRRIGGGSDGIASGRDGRIYVTNLAHDAVEVLDPVAGTIATVASGPAWIWPDTISLDDRGALYVSTNHLNHVFAGETTFDDTTINFRIFKIPPH